MKTHYQPALDGFRNPMQEIWNKLPFNCNEYMSYMSMEFPDDLDLSFLTKEMMICEMDYFEVATYRPPDHKIILIPDHGWIGLSEIRAMNDGDISLNLHMGNGIDPAMIGYIHIFASVHCNVILPRWMAMDIRMIKRRRLRENPSYQLQAQVLPDPTAPA